MAVQKQPASAGEWLVRIRDEEMPALGATVALVHSITEDDRAPSERLARVILQDAAMTTKVLKLANSAFYNPSRQTISTISRAIVVLGFNVVAEMSIGIRLVDSLLAGGVRQRLVEEMARNFHAAVLARALSGIRRDGHSEEVFIAALLSRLGEMAFWSFGGESAERLDTQLSADDQSPDDVQQAVLGFKLRQLSLGLAREWKLGSLLLATLEGGKASGPGERAVVLAQSLAREAHGGWSSGRSVPLIKEVAEFVGLAPDALQARLVDITDEAAQVAMYFGATDAARCIALINRSTPELAGEDDGGEVAAPDPALQLRILRELSGLIAGGAGLNEVMGLVLEGVYRGVGFDRVLFALLAPNRQQLVGKAGLGRAVEALCKRFVFSLDASRGDLLNDFFRQPVAIRLPSPGDLAGREASRLKLVTGTGTACMAPIVFKGHVIGLVYADRADDDASIDDERFEAFQLFVQQISLASATGISAGRRE